MDELRKAFKELELDYLNTQKKLVEKSLKCTTEHIRTCENMLDKINSQIQVAASTVYDDSD